MRITVIFSDQNVYINGVARQVELPTYDSNWHAIQWYGNSGDIEVKLGASFFIENFSILEPFVAAWHAAKPISNSSISQKSTNVEEM